MLTVDIKLLTTDLNLSQRELAKLLKVDDSSITKVKKGLMRFPTTWADALADHFPNFEISKYLIDFDDSEPDPYEIYVRRRNKLFNEYTFIPFIKEENFENFIKSFTSGDQKSFLNGVDQRPVLAGVYGDGYHLMMRTFNDKMDDGSKNSICLNDIMLLRLLDRFYWNSVFSHLNHPFLIVTKDKMELCHVKETETTLICKFLNNKYDDLEIARDEVIAVYHFFMITQKVINFSNQHGNK